MIMSSREEILERLKSPGWAQPLPSPAVISTKNHIASGDVQTFVNQAAVAGAQVEEVSSLAEVTIKIRQIVQDEQLQKIVITDEEIVQGIDWGQLSRETESKVQAIAQLSGDDYRNYVVEADLGVTGCKYALAETGTVVLEHNHTNERLVSHAPNHYVCIVDRQQILEDRYTLASFFGSNPSSAAWTLVTGVSRTADVAMQVVLGMHGPRKVTIFIVG